MKYAKHLKNLLLPVLLTTLIGAPCFSEEPTTGILVAGTILPSGDFPSVVANHGYGGWHITTNPASIADYLLEVGTAAWDTTTEGLYIWDGTDWNLFAQGGETASGDQDAILALAGAFAGSYIAYEAPGESGERLYYTGMVNGAPRFHTTSPLREVAFQGTYWELTTTLETYTNLSTSILPPSTGWILNGNPVSDVDVSFTSSGLKKVRDDAEIANNALEVSLQGEIATSLGEAVAADTVLSNALIAADAAIVSMITNFVNTGGIGDFATADDNMRQIIYNHLATEIGTINTNMADNLAAAYAADVALSNSINAAILGVQAEIPVAVLAVATNIQPMINSSIYQHILAIESNAVVSAAGDSNLWAAISSSTSGVATAYTEADNRLRSTLYNHIAAGINTNKFYINSISNAVTSNLLVVVAIVADHTNNYNNPHLVTKKQVGLEYVPDFPVENINYTSSGWANVAHPTSKGSLQKKFSAQDAVISSLTNSAGTQAGRLVVLENMINRLWALDLSGNLVPSGTTLLPIAHPSDWTWIMSSSDGTLTPSDAGTQLDYGWVIDGGNLTPMP